MWANNRQNAGGFTLVETVAALAISAVLLGGAYEVFSHLLEFQNEQAARNNLDQDLKLIAQQMTDAMRLRTTTDPSSYVISSTPAFEPMPDGSSMMVFSDSIAVTRTSPGGGGATNTLSLQTSCQPLPAGMSYPSDDLAAIAGVGQVCNNGVGCPLGSRAVLSLSGLNGFSSALPAASRGVPTAVAYAVCVIKEEPTTWIPSQAPSQGTDPTFYLQAAYAGVGRKIKTYTYSFTAPFIPFIGGSDIGVLSQ